MSEENSTASVRDLVEREFGDRVVAVDEHTVWVSGINQNPVYLAGSIARAVETELDIGVGPIHSDMAVENGGVQFNFGPRSLY